MSKLPPTKLYEDDIAEFITKPVSEPSYLSGKSVLTHPFKLKGLASLCAGSGE
jgi:hypothetical protein